MRTPLLSQFLSNLPQYHTSVSLSTLWLYTNACKNFIRIVGDKRMASYTPLHVEHFKCERIKQAKPNTVNLEVRACRAIFNRARKLRIISQCPFKEVSLVRVPMTTPAYMSIEQIDKLLSTVSNPTLKAFFLFLSQTGCRLSEGLGLSWNSLDLNRKVVSLTQTKTGAIRVLPLTTSLYTCLSNLPHKSEFVFCRENGEPYHKRFLQECFKRLVNRLGFDSRLHIHSLRHSFASNLVRKNVSLYTVSQLLGHSDLKTTQIYAHLATSELHSIVELLA